MKEASQRFFMFHKTSANASSSPNQSQTNLHLVAENRTRSAHPSRLVELAVIASRRCSSFLAEAAVLVLVFGILDYFMLRGRIELPWIVGALAISLGLLAASIATDFGAQRWIKAHP
jgi:hypothetical protein